MLVLLALKYRQRSLCVCCYCVFRKCELLRRCCDCNCYVAIATSMSSFATIATTNALSPLRVPGDTATQPLLLLTSFAAVAALIAYADASVVRVALLTALKLIFSCYCNCYAAIATPIWSFGSVATTNALSQVRVPRHTATLTLLLLTSFATITTGNASADATVARVALLRAIIVRML